MKKKYWNEEQEKLLIQFVNEPDSKIRSNIYSRLRPAILIMIESILRRYFYSFLLGEDQSEIINDAEAFLIEKEVLIKFQPDKATGYSFLGTCIKHYFIDYFKKVGNSKTESLYNEENELAHDIGYDSSYNDQNEEYLIMKNKAKALFVEKIEHEDILQALIEVLEDGDFNRYYLTYFLMKRTGRNGRTLHRLLFKKGLGTLITDRYSIARFERIIKKYVEENGDHDNYIKDALSDQNLFKTKRIFKIEDKSKKAKRKSKLKTSTIH